MNAPSFARCRRRPPDQFAAAERPPRSAAGWLATRWLATPVVWAALGCIAAAPPAVAAGSVGDWPLARGTAEGTGATGATLPDELVERWTYKAGEPVETTAVIADGRVFVADVAGTLHAISLTDGSGLWKTATEIGFLAPPAVSGDTVVIGDVEGTVFAFDAADGEQRWRFSTEAEINAGAAFYKDRVLVPSQDGNLYCLQVADGSLVWKYETSDQIQCSPTIAGSRTFLGGCDGQLHSVDLETGNAAADPLPLGGPTISTPAVLGDRAFLTTHAGQVLAFDWKKNQPLWQYADEGRSHEYRSSTAVSDQAVVASSKNRLVTALDPATGQVRWTHSLRRYAEGSPVIAGDDVWIAGTDGRLLRLALADGTVRWQYEIRGSFFAPPAISGEMLVIPNDDGVVMAFGPAVPPATPE